MKHMKDSGDKWSFGNEMERGLQRLALSEIVYIRLKFINDTALFLLNVNPVRWDELVIELRHLISKLAHDVRETHFVISQSFTDFKSLGEIYNDNYLKLMRYGFFLKDRTLIEPNHLPGLPEAKLEYDMGDFMEQLKRKQYQKAFTGFWNTSTCARWIIVPILSNSNRRWGISYLTWRPRLGK